MATIKVDMGKEQVKLLSFLGAVIIGTFLGALVVVTGSSASRGASTSGHEVLMEVAVAGFQGSIVALVAAVLIWFPTYRFISGKLRLALQLPAMMTSGAATAVPVAIADAALNLNPGFTGIWAVYTFFAGIWSASVAWLLVTVMSLGSSKLHYVRWVGFVVLAAGALAFGLHAVAEKSWV
jgi:hypothetical protein